MIADVTNRKRGVLHDFTLDAEVPLLGVRRGQVVLSGPEGRSLAEGQVVLEGTRYFESRRTYGCDAAAADEAANVLGSRRRQTCVSVHRRIVQHGRVVVDSVRDRKAAANRSLAALKRVPGKTEIRRPIIKVFPQEIASGAFTREAQQDLRIVQSSQRS